MKHFLFLGLLISHLSLANPTYEQTINKVYDSISGYVSLSDDPSFQTDENRLNGTYGEITYTGGKTLLKELHVSAHDVVYDFGSGVGKFVMQTYLTSGVKKAVGIELSKERAKRAAQALEIFKKSGFSNKKRELNYIQGDFTEEKIDDATVIYMCNTTWSDNLMKKTIDHLANLKKGLRVAVQKKLPDNTVLTYDRTIKVAYSWSSSPLDTHIYVKK